MATDVTATAAAARCDCPVPQTGCLLLSTCTPTCLAWVPLSQPDGAGHSWSPSCIPLSHLGHLMPNPDYLKSLSNNLAGVDLPQGCGGGGGRHPAPHRSLLCSPAAGRAQVCAAGRVFQRAPRSAAVGEPCCASLFRPGPVQAAHRVIIRGAALAAASAQSMCAASGVAQAAQMGPFGAIWAGIHSRWGASCSHPPAGRVVHVSCKWAHRASYVLSLQQSTDWPDRLHVHGAQVWLAASCLQSPQTPAGLPRQRLWLHLTPGAGG